MFWPRSRREDRRVRAERARPQVVVQSGVGMSVATLQAREHEPIVVVGGSLARGVLGGENGLGNSSLDLEHKCLLQPRRGRIRLERGGVLSAGQGAAEIAALN